MMKLLKMKLLKILSFLIVILIITMVLLVSSKEPEIRTPVFSPDDQFIIFSSCHRSNENIYRIRSNGTDLKRLTTSNERKHFDPVYSPDGSKIVFSSIKKKANLYIMDSDGANIKRLTTGDYGDVSPVFSPDDKCIYFLRARDVTVRRSRTLRKLRWYDIYSINTDGSNLKKITNIDVWLMGNLSVSPDGKQLLVYIYDYNDSGDSLWLISVDNPEEMKPIRPNGQKGDFYHPKFSPEGKFLLFVWPGSHQGYFGHEIYIMDMKTREAKKITDFRSYISSPSFSHDGKKIVFVNVQDVADSEEKHELWLINRDGTNPQHIELAELEI